MLIIKKIACVIFVCILCGCSQNKGLETENDFFFPNDKETFVYNAEFTFGNEVDLVKEVELQVNLVTKGEAGNIYQMAIEGVEAEEYIRSRLNMGFFYVATDEIYLYRGEAVPTESEVVEKGIIICQNASRESEAREDGMQDYIECDGKKCYYGSYNVLTETGFYETFVWEKGIGLKEYKSGFGAEREGIHIILKSSE